MKITRHRKIIELINIHDIETQEELARMLIESGYNVTQATISRDIRELQLTKVAARDGKQKYVMLHTKPADMNEKYLRVLSDGFTGMEMAQNILVIKTVSGMAMAVAAALDELNFNEIVGCIAGDDTIMCAVRSVEDTFKLTGKINNILEIHTAK
ncbi:arginine repressor [Parasporobacterium paucivorans]|uniref:Arginine repressor n=1 Tax=Parasporobacterium paucivorans DSM 15970 TaxID=1122934 RepID=A0A1M6FA66_9FIRM|nr:arginine repressor [Parasporobacterium paucivorans]SHI94658.1 transcriptional regulator, ArgR family [Parasporobacterium paucivorans DSM 15970]